MKKMLAMFVTLSASIVLGDEALRVHQTVSGDVGVGVDLTAVAKNQNVQEARGLRKVWVGIRESTFATGRAVKENPGKTALAIGAGYVGIRAVQGKLDDDWKSVRKSLGLRSSSGKSGSGDDSRVESPDGTSVFVNSISITGDGNSVNQTIVVQQPQGSGTGQAPNNNSGSGGQG